MAKDLKKGSLVRIIRKFKPLGLKCNYRQRWNYFIPYYLIPYSLFHIMQLQLFTALTFRVDMHNFQTPIYPWDCCCLTQDLLNQTFMQNYFSTLLFELLFVDCQSGYFISRLFAYQISGNYLSVTYLEKFLQEFTGCL